MKNNYEFYKYKEDDIIYWVDDSETWGEFLFTFDKKKIYDYYKDYPNNLTSEEKRIFDRENPGLKE